MQLRVPSRLLSHARKHRCPVHLPRDVSRCLKAPFHLFRSIVWCCIEATFSTPCRARCTERDWICFKSVLPWHYGCSVAAGCGEKARRSCRATSNWTVSNRPKNRMSSMLKQVLVRRGLLRERKPSLSVERTLHRLHGCAQQLDSQSRSQNLPIQGTFHVDVR